MPMQQDQYWRDANKPIAQERAEQIQAQHYAESAARVKAAEDAARLQDEKARQERKEREEFMQRVQANRDLVNEAMAAGLAPVLNVPSMSTLYAEQHAEQQAEMKQRQQELRTSQYAWNGQGMMSPPRIHAAQKVQYFAELNAEMGYPDQPIQ